MLRSLISERKEANSFYRAQGTTDAAKIVADSGHGHYITVLESALKALDAVVPKPAPAQGSSIPVPRDSTAKVALNNVFIPLAPKEAGTSVDPDSEDEYENKENLPVRKGNKSKSGKKRRTAKGKKTTLPNSKAQRKAESEETQLLEEHMIRNWWNSDWQAELEEDDLDFMIYCFFQDFHEVREYLLERWCDYHQDGTLSLAAVSLLTNTAFELFQEAEKELLEAIPVRTGLRDFENMAMRLFTEVGLDHVDYGA